MIITFYRHLSGCAIRWQVTEFSQQCGLLTVKLWPENSCPQGGTWALMALKAWTFPVIQRPVCYLCHSFPSNICPGRGAGTGASGEGWLVKFSVCLQACYLLYFPEGEIKVSKVYWFAYSDSVSRQGIGSETNFLASFPKHANSLPCSASTGSQESISENLIRKHMKGDSETTEALRKS